MDSAILTDKSLSSRLVLKETYCAVQWKGLFPVDNVIHFSNNWDQVYKWDQCTVPLEHMGERGAGGAEKGPSIDSSSVQRGLQTYYHYYHYFLLSFEANFSFFQWPRAHHVTCK